MCRALVFAPFRLFLGLIHKVCSLLVECGIVFVCRARVSLLGVKMRRSPRRGILQRSLGPENLFKGMLGDQKVSPVAVNQQPGFHALPRPPTLISGLILQGKLYAPHSSEESVCMESWSHRAADAD